MLRGKVFFSVNNYCKEMKNMPETNDTKLYEKIIARREVFRGKLIRVEHWDAELASGRVSLREIVKNANAAAVVPVDADGNVTLVRQYRAAMGEIMMEIPAGKKDSVKEDSLVCAKRELEEETGLSAQNWKLLCDARMSPGFLTEQVSIYLATRLSQGSDHPDEDEYLNVVKMPLGDAVELVRQGKITDAKTVIGLMMAKDCLE